MKRQLSNTLIIAITVVAALCICSVTLIIVTLDKSELPEGWLGLFLGFLGSLIVAVVSLAKLDKIDARQDAMGRQIDYLANGGSDAKMRAAVADVVNPDMIRDDASEQLVADRIHRAAGHLEER